MLFVLPLSITALVYMLFVVVYTVAKYLKSDKESRYNQLKSFRKGNFGLIYLGAIPLYLAGNLFNGLGIFQTLFNSFSQSLMLVVLSFNWDVVTPLMSESFFYKIAVYICFSAASCNTLIFTVSLVLRRFRNFILLNRFKKSEKNLCIFIGYNERTKELINSADRDKYDILLLCPENEDVKRQAFVCDFAVQSFSYSDSPMPIIDAYCGNVDKRMIRMIINTENDEQNFVLATEVGEYTKRLKLDSFSFDSHSGFSAYVFGNEKNESSFARLSGATRGCIQCINPHKMIAFDFVEKHPITEMLTEEDIDPVTRTVKDEVSFNFIMVGFGRTSRQLLRIHSANNQLLTMREGKPAPKTVSYHIFDVAKAENDINLNHSFLRYSRWYKEEKRDEKYPIPQSVFDIAYSHIDVGDAEFYPKLREQLTKGNGKLCNSIVISFGSDLTNIDMAEKLYEKIKEWGLDRFTRIFVKVRNKSLSENVVLANYPGKEIEAFGLEGETVTSLSYIIGENTETMAKRQHLNYTKTDNPKMSEEAARDKAMSTWYDVWGQVQRDSNVYACLSLRLKLQLFGFDIAPLDDPRPDASKEFYREYFQGVAPDEHFMRYYTEEELSDYTVRRHLVTRMEHQRWNAYMISVGYVPAVEDEFLNMNKQMLHAVRKHANIVTFEGLYSYRRLMAKQRNFTEEDADVIKYDYRLTDSAAELLYQSKRKIVRKG